MSFKYRFILSFVLLEVFFITLIVIMNFITINDSSKSLINKKISSTVEFFDQLLKVPVSIYDLATIDNLLENTQKIEYINSILVLDSQNRVLSSIYNYDRLSQEKLLEIKDPLNYSFSNESFTLRYKKLFEEDTYLGSVYIIFDNSDNQEFIEKNKNRTLMIVLFEILISTFLSYLIGRAITLKLTNLSGMAEQIGENKVIEMPYLDTKDEIGILSNSMNQMQIDLKTRNDKLKKLAIELNNQRNELLEANKSKDDFLANMSHELKTPLNSINVISSVMVKNKKGLLNEEQIKNIEIINNCGKDLLYLINDVLDISKLEDGNLELDCKVIDIKKLFDSIYEMFEPQVSTKGLVFDYKIDNSCTLIYSDEMRIRQIVKNLLSNALKFTKEGSICLYVKNIDNHNISIEVKDDGIGISKEQQGKIFDRFKQADGTINRKFGGTGLGLAISKELVNLLEGQLELNSEINMGSSFKISLPINTKKINLQELNKKENINSTKEKNKLLLLDNDPINFMTFVSKVKETHEIEQVRNLLDLVKKIKETSFYKIIIDISNLNIEDVNKLIDIGLDNIILIYADTYDESLDKKVFAKFKKPFDEKELIDKIG